MSANRHHGCGTSARKVICRQLKLSYTTIGSNFGAANISSFDLLLAALGAAMMVQPII